MDCIIQGAAKSRTQLSDFSLHFKEARGWGGKGWEFGISRCKLSYIGRLNNKVLLYSTGNYIQHPVINHNGKEYTCITESLCCTHNIYFNKIKNKPTSMSQTAWWKMATFPCVELTRKAREGTERFLCQAWGSSSGL